MNFFKNIFKPINLLLLLSVILAFSTRAFAEDDTDIFEDIIVAEYEPEIDLEAFAIPPHLGEIKDSYFSDPDKFVIHIQDAHCNPFAQHKIAEIINYLSSEYGINIVNLEGGIGAYDLSIFHSMSGEEIRREVADYFLKKGEVTGPEFFAINNPGKVELWGVENKDLYIANLKVYRNSLKYKEIIDKYLEQLVYILDNLKIHIFSSELMEIDKAYNSYKEKKKPFRDYVEFMLNMAGNKYLDVNSYDNLRLLALSLKLEDEVDFKKANNEREMLVR